jgi:hypothetical protein
LNAPTLSPPTFSDEEKAIIEQQLERLVADTHFSHSRRFPSFLRYVVSETLAGNTDQLKERTLGIEIFGKHADYDTATEPIVRVTAAEIRKRIAQYYQEPGHETEMRVSLPPGSYVPQFEFPAPAAPTLTPAAEPFPPPPGPAAPLPAVSAAASQRKPRLLLFALAAVVLAAGLAALIWQRTRPSAVAQFWDPILNTSEPILFCVADQTGYGTQSLRDAADPTHQVQLKDNLTAVVIDDLSVITKIAGVLESSGRHYRLLGENATTLSDLRNGPSVMVGAFDNAWTLRLLNPLRYHFANNPEMTTFSIVDTKAPGGRTPWMVNRVQQIATNNYEDYAIVARFTDPTTGKPTLIAAGIGRGGTIAAGEFLTSRTLLREVLSKQPSTAQNVEVVLSTRIIGGEPGTPTIAAVYYW